MPRDLFSDPIDRTIGQGLGTLLADKANGMTLDDMRENWRSGRYRGACPKIARMFMEWK